MKQNDSHWQTAGMSAWPPSLGMTLVHGAIYGFAKGKGKNGE